METLNDSVFIVDLKVCFCLIRVEFNQISKGYDYQRDQKVAPEHHEHAHTLAQSRHRGDVAVTHCHHSDESAPHRVPVVNPTLVVVFSIVYWQFGGTQDERGYQNGDYEQKRHK